MLNLMVGFSSRFMTFRGCFSKTGKFSQAHNFWWIRLNLIKLTYLKSASKCNSFDVTIGIKILVFRVSVTIEPRHSLLTVRYHEMLDSDIVTIKVELDTLDLLKSLRSEGMYIRHRERVFHQNVFQLDHKKFRGSFDFEEDLSILSSPGSSFIFYRGLPYKIERKKMYYIFFNIFISKLTYSDHLESSKHFEKRNYYPKLKDREF